MSPPSPGPEGSGSATASVGGARVARSPDCAEVRVVTPYPIEASFAVRAAGERAERTNALFVVVLTLLSTVLALYDFVLLMSGI